MSQDLTKYPWVLQPVIELESQEDLLDLLPEKVVASAEAYIEKRQHELARESHVDPRPCLVSLMVLS